MDIPLPLSLVLSLWPESFITGHWECERRSLLMSVEFVAFDDDRLLLRLKRLEYLEKLRLRLTKSGRNVTRQEQRIASAGSTCVHVYSWAMVSENRLGLAGKRKSGLCYRSSPLSARFRLWQYA